MRYRKFLYHATWRNLMQFRTIFTQVSEIPIDGHLGIENFYTSGEIVPNCSKLHQIVKSHPRETTLSQG